MLILPRIIKVGSKCLYRCTNAGTCTYFSFVRLFVYIFKLVVRKLFHKFGVTKVRFHGNYLGKSFTRVTTRLVIRRTD